MIRQRALSPVIAVSAFIVMMWGRRLLVVVIFVTVLTVRGQNNITSIRDIDRFPVCVTDEDCDDISDKKHVSYKCFQYMCFPWNSSSETKPFRRCKRRSDCKGLSAAEGGVGGDGDCYRHQDRRNVFSGICLNQR